MWGLVIEVVEKLANFKGGLLYNEGRDTSYDEGHDMSYDEGHEYIIR